LQVPSNFAAHLNTLFAYHLTDKHHLTFNGIGATDHFDFSDTESSAYFKNGFQAEGIHLRSHLTNTLTSHLSLTRSYNFLNINFGVGPSRDDGLSSEKFIYTAVQINVPTYTLQAYHRLDFQLSRKRTQ